MYKLFLCLRYLRRRYIALVAIIGMALCVFMVLVVVSVMNGFLALVERSAKGMMGDIILDAPAGLANYEKLIPEIDALPEVKASTPVVYSVGLLRLGPVSPQTVQVIGLKLPDPERPDPPPGQPRIPNATDVATFAQGLHPDWLKERPSFALPEGIRQEMADRVQTARRLIASMDADGDALFARLQAELAKPEDQRNERAIAEFRRTLDEIDRHIERFRGETENRSDWPGIILGVDIPGTTRQDPDTGAYERALSPGLPVRLTLVPVDGQRTVTALSEPVNKPFLYLGDARTGMYQVDSGAVYVDIHTLQEILGLDARVDEETGVVRPARCSQVQIKVVGNDGDREYLRQVAGRVRSVWSDFAQRNPDMGNFSVEIRTWREKQDAYVGAIEKQRTLVAIMFGVVSLVAVVLVFAIFYMMVVQKTKDIGILKSIGATSGGVAGIFLLYGMAVGLVGSAIGAVGGVAFVREINPIHDWIADRFGWRVFDKRMYMFDQIPNEVQGEVVLTVIVGAILAGVVGALLPALAAGRMQPVEALRYE